MWVTDLSHYLLAVLEYFQRVQISQYQPAAGTLLEIEGSLLSFVFVPLYFALRMRGPRTHDPKTAHPIHATGRVHSHGGERREAGLWLVMVVGVRGGGVEAGERPNPTLTSFDRTLGKVPADERAPTRAVSTMPSVAVPAAALVQFPLALICRARACASGEWRGTGPSSP